MKAFTKILAALLILAVIGLGFLIWLQWPRDFEDNTPLPKGKVMELIPNDRDSTSKLSLSVRMDLKTLNDTINRSPHIPREYPFNVPEGSGKITRSDVRLFREASDRLGLDGTIRFDGELDGPAWTKVKSARASYKGTSLALRVTKDWNLDLKPDVKAKILSIDVSGAPDGIAKWILNKYILPDMTKQAEQIALPPIKPAVEEAWRFSGFEWQTSRKPSVVLGFRPVRARLAGPVIDEITNAIVFNLGFDIRTSCALKPATRAWTPIDSGKLPDLSSLPLEPTPSTFRLPLIASMDTLADLFKPQIITFPGGRMEVRSLELSESKGKIYARLNGDLEAPPKLGGFLPTKTRVSLVASAKLACDPKTGELRLDDLSFIPASNSYLVGHLSGPGAQAFEASISALVPVFSGYLCNRARSELNLRSQDLLNAQIKALADASPDFKDYIKTLKPRVRNIDVKPESITIKNGHIMLVLWASADLSLSVK